MGTNLNNPSVRYPGVHGTGVHGTGVRLRIRTTAQQCERHRDDRERTGKHGCLEPRQ